MSKKKNPDINEAIKSREIERMMKRQMAPPDFRLDSGPIGIDVVDRTYGLRCDCGCIDFSEDEEFSKIFCSECKKTVAVRAVEIGWLG